MSLFGGDAPSPAPSGSSFSVSSISSVDSTPPHPAAGEDTLAEAQQEHFDDAEIGDDPLSDWALDRDPGGDQQHDLDGDDHSFPDERIRFQGADNLWRYYTRDERALWAALEKERAEDLAAHLYNIHAWKQSLRSKDAPSLAAHLVSKKEWIETGAGDDLKWTPKDLWTRWPMDPAHVPRTGNQSSSGQELRQALIAVGERTVQELWKERPDEDMHPVEDIATSPVASRSRSPVSARGRSRSRSQSLPQSLSSDLSDDDQSEGTPDPFPNDDASLPRPVLSADVQRAERLLGPIANHTLSRLDGLLLALHHNRVGQHGLDHDARASSLRASSANRSSSRSRSAKWRRRKASGNVSADDSDDPAQDHKRQRTGSVDSSGHRQRESRRRRRSVSTASVDSTGSIPEDSRRYKAPRDWSEVLGLASLINWDPAVVQRAKDRCTALFQESMTFVTLENEPTIKTEPDHAEDPTQGPIKLEDISQPMSDAKTDIFYRCPFASCPQHYWGYSKARGYRFREHMKVAHRFAAHQVERLESIIVFANGPGAAPPALPAWTPPNPLVCPHDDCRSRGKVFEKAFRLLEHIKRTHKYDPRLGPSPPQDEDGNARTKPTPEVKIKPTTAAQQERIAEFLVDGVHNDGFLLPV